MIPDATNYPISLDTDTNLFLVHDSLRVRLLEDYNPGDVSIFIEGNEDVISRFPPTGIITLTEQCSDLDERAISLFYGSRTDTTFDQLELLPYFKDVVKPKKITNVTMNVLDKHHNHLKDALISIETFLGVQGQTDLVPLGKTLTGRINFLKKLILRPRAWFTADKKFGLIPLCVTFKDESLRTDVDGDIIYTWSFGDQEYSISQTISNLDVIDVTSSVPYGAINVIATDLDGNTIKKCYSSPGIYDVKLTVKNDYGEDTVIFEEFITAKTEAPEEAIINIIPKNTQDYTDGIPSGGPYTTSPKIRSPINTFIEFDINQGENPNTPGYSYGGEVLDGLDNAIDPITQYTWKLNDDLDHENNYFARASYGIGGYYDLTLRVDTKYGAYRITSYKQSIDIVESQNLWLFNYKTKNSVDGGIVEAYEFGLLSETFKKLGNQTVNITRSNAFLNYLSDPLYDSNTEERSKKEFFRNNIFTRKGTIDSGDKGESLIFWADGGSVNDSEEIKIKSYNAFSDSYSSLNSITGQPWNWTAFVSQENVDFILGQGDFVTPFTNPTNNKRTTYNLQSGSVTGSSTLNLNDFENGAQELLYHSSDFANSGEPTNGYFATYRSTWKDSSGYLLRNSSVNDFFRIASFYRTNGTLSNVYSTITKLPDMIGSVKVEGELVTLSNGVFFFDNTGEIVAWNDVSLTWEVGRSSSSSLSFRSLQDDNVSGFDKSSNTLLAASDNDRLAYLSFDYSNKSFIKFNGTDLTFSSAGNRPSGIQFKMGIY